MSATRIAAIFRVPAIARPQAPCRIAQGSAGAARYLGGRSNHEPTAEGRLRVRLDRFATPPGNDRSLRTADGRNRRRADLADRGRGARSWAACRLRSSEAVTPRRTVAVGVASDGPPAATDVASSTLLRGRCQQHWGFYPGEVLVTLRL